MEQFIISEIQVRQPTEAEKADYESGNWRSITPIEDWNKKEIYTTMNNE